MSVSENTRIEFGKFTGKTFGEIPAAYWLWLDKQPWFNASGHLQARIFLMENKKALILKQKNKILAEAKK